MRNSERFPGHRRGTFRRKHKRYAGRPRRGSGQRLNRHDASACIQPLDAAFDADGGAFLEGWLRAENVSPAADSDD
jgi:hypothetical protein